tara:strand:- start:24 stop:1484 length:1461 start_codon:yes stop_codon:yes gene_type:complete
MDKFNKLALLAVDHQQKGRFGEAKIIYNELLNIQEKNPQILRLLGMVEYELKNYLVSLEHLSKSIEINPNDSETYTNRGMVNVKLDNIDQAIEDYEKAAKLDNKNPNPFFNLGHLFKEQDNLEKSIDYFDKSLVIDNKNYKAFHNRAVVKSLQNKYDEAINDFDEAIKIKNDYADAYFYKSIIQLQNGDYINGWRNYEWRWNIKNFSSPIRDFKKPYWNGKQSLNNKRILIHGEQGLGDQIQFIRYISLIKKLTPHVFLEVDKKLVKLFKDSNILDNIFARGDQLPEFDYHCPLLSLPLKFSTSLENIPSPKQYIFPNSQKDKKWKNIIDRSKINIGIAWKTKKNVQVQGRSIELDSFKEISSLKNVSLYSLQIFDAEDEIENKNPNLNLHIFNKDFDNEAPFIDTAAVMKNLDLVITIDTSIAHLAGALGCKTFLLLSDKPHWTWMLDKIHTPWYPSFKIYRKSKNQDWTNVFNIIKADIEEIKK